MLVCPHLPKRRSPHEHAVVSSPCHYSVGATTVWENSPMWDKVDDSLKPFRVAARGSRMIGWAGPPTSHATEALTKYIITDMYAKAVQGTTPADCVKWAEVELKKVYES